MTRSKLKFAILCAVPVLLFVMSFQLVLAEGGNAEVTRIKNMQYFELKPNNADVTREANMQYFELKPNNADVSRYRNLQYFEAEPNNADVIRYGNLQCLELAELPELPGELRVNVTSLKLTDQNGTPKTNFTQGDVLQINFTIKNTGCVYLLRGLVATSVLNPSNTPLFLSYTFTDLPTGVSKEFIVGYRVPADADVGIYSVKVLVFTDWPSEGGYGLTVEEFTFTVS